MVLLSCHSFRTKFDRTDNYIKIEAVTFFILWLKKTVINKDNEKNILKYFLYNLVFKGLFMF